MRDLFKLMLRSLARQTRFDQTIMDRFNYVLSSEFHPVVVLRERELIQVCLGRCFCYYLFTSFKTYWSEKWNVDVNIRHGIQDKYCNVHCSLDNLQSYWRLWLFMFGNFVDTRDRKHELCSAAVSIGNPTTRSFMLWRYPSHDIPFLSRYRVDNMLWSL